MNVPKMTVVDLPLFNGIVSDLFPGIDTPAIDYGKVKPIRFSFSNNYKFEKLVCNFTECCKRTLLF